MVWSLWVSASAGGGAAVDGDGLAGDPRRLVGGEEGDGVADVVRRAGSAHRDHAGHLLGDLAWPALAFHQADGEGVGGDPVTGGLERKVSHERDSAPLAGAVEGYANVLSVGAGAG